MIMSAAVRVFVIGAFLSTLVAACPLVPVHTCVKNDDPEECTAVEVCEKPHKEKCGDSYCEYPYTCATSTKKECDDFQKLKVKCSQKKVCKPISTSCGYGVCGPNQNCVKQRVCSVKSNGGRKLLQGPTSLDTYSPYESHPYTKECSYCAPHESLVCEDVYKCIAKESCQEVFVEKCYPSTLVPGIDYGPGGHEFRWKHDSITHCAGQVCAEGTRCADVLIQTCNKKCGNTECGYGYACVADDDECEQYPYLETVCRDVAVPTCVPLSSYVQSTYKPPCKTEYKCEEEESVCGNVYCAAGQICVVEEKKQCGTTYEQPDHGPVVEKPKPEPKKRAKEYPVAASSYAFVEATDKSVVVDLDSKSLNGGKALAIGKGKNEGVDVKGITYADGDEAFAIGKVNATHGYGIFKGTAYSKHSEGDKLFDDY